MLNIMTRWVAHYGYALVAVFLFVEGAGAPVPGETALVTAAALAGRGTMSLAGVMLAGAIGTVSGCLTGYWIGLRGGTALLRRHGGWFHLDEARLARTHEFFERHGAKTVLLGRFVAFLRSFVGLFAGASRMSLRRFLTYNVIGGTVWVVAFGTLGFLFGRNLPRLVHDIGRVSLLLAILVALVATVLLAWRWFSGNRAEVAASIDARWRRITTPPARGGAGDRATVWQTIVGRFAREEYLALHLLAGFVLSLAVIGVFASITESIVDSSPLTRFDTVVAARLRGSAGPGALETFGIVSDIGARGVMTLLFAAGAFFYALRRRGLELAGWCVAFIGGSLLDAALRFVVRRSDLPFADVVLIDWGTGLVSAQVLGVVVGYGMAAYLLCTAVNRAATRAAIVTLAVAIVVAITVARLYLGQHYVSDASAGLAAGLIWLASCVSAIEIVRQHERATG
jgi:undecaprenyl-diphosphatase